MRSRHGHFVPRIQSSFPAVGAIFSSWIIGVGSAAGSAMRCCARTVTRYNERITGDIYSGRHTERTVILASRIARHSPSSPLRFPFSSLLSLCVSFLSLSLSLSEWISNFPPVCRHRYSCNYYYGKRATRLRDRGNTYVRTKKVTMRLPILKSFRSLSNGESKILFLI